MTIPSKTCDLFSGILKLAAPPPLMSVSQWADEYRTISEEYGTEPGKWDSDRAPYQKIIMDAFTSKGVSKVVAMLGAQLGKSEIMFNVAGRFITLDPCPILIVQPTVMDSQDWSKERLEPSIASTPILAKKIHEQKSRKSDNTILKKMFPGGYLALVGSNSPSGLAKRSIRLLLFDEVDRFNPSAGTEGDPVKLAEKRTSNFWNSIIGMFSTPTDIKSRIYNDYMLGTQEEWQHKCPNCGEYHWVTIWDMDYSYESFEIDGKKSYRVDSVKWRCPDCGFEFSEAEMKSTPQKYIQLNKNINNPRSFHVNSFASPWQAWSKIILEYLESKDSPKALKTFINTRLAELYKPIGELKNADVLMKRRETYEAEVPDKVLILTAAVDVQDNRLEYEVAGWGREFERWGIRKGIILGVPDQKNTWDQLDQQLDKDYKMKDGTILKIARTFIDCGGHYSKDVYKYCMENMYKGRFGIRGSQQFNVPLINGTVKARGYPNLPVISIGVNDGKQYIFQRLKEKTEPGPYYMHFPDDDKRGYDSVYYKGLLSEALREKIVKGRLILAWVNIATDKRNEPLDMQVYNLAAIESIIKNEEDWKPFEDVIYGAEEIVQKEENKEYGCIKKGLNYE